MVIGFERQEDANACVEELRIRFAPFGLKLNDGKSRLHEFGRYAIERRAKRGDGRTVNIRRRCVRKLTRVVLS